MAIKTTVVTLAAGAYPANPQVTFDFDPQSIAVAPKSTTDEVRVSFDGATDDLVIAPPYNAPIGVDGPARKVWLKTAAAGPLDVIVTGQG